MTRYYEQGLPQSNYLRDLSMVALGTNNHVAQVFIDPTNEYGARIVLRCWSEHDNAPHWYSLRDHKGDVFVAELDEVTDTEGWKEVWSEPENPDTE